MNRAIGVVVIGRNEGTRLIRCLDSMIGRAERIVYVDSGSTDGSAAAAQGRGADVVNLDISAPFSAARARNAGFRYVCQLDPEVFAVQFIDGDCVVSPGWLEQAASLLADEPDVAIVCGRIRERNPEATIYNRLCDMEWNRPTGAVDSCGGIVMIKRAFLDRVGGYNETLIAGEDPELCVRIRAAGGTVWRLAAEMATHDAAIVRFGQWWKRSRRTGWAYAAGAALHGTLLGGHNVRSLLRAMFWGAALPVVSGLVIAASVWNLRLLTALLPVIALYLLVILRTFRGGRAAGRSSGDALLYAFFCALGKPAEALGAAQYAFQRLFGRASRLIEHKPMG